MINPGFDSNLCGCFNRIIYTKSIARMFKFPKDMSFFFDDKHACFYDCDEQGLWDYILRAFKNFKFRQDCSLAIY